MGEKLKGDVRSGALFAFTNKKRTRLRILYFDGTGLWLMTKRLEKGTFFWPKAAESGQGGLKLAPEAFALLTDGIDMHGAKPRGWYQREKKNLPQPASSACKVGTASALCHSSMMTPLEARLTEENARQALEIKLLKEKIDLLVRRIFGKSSEQLDDRQLMLLLQGGDDGAKKDPASSTSPGALEAEIKERGRDNKHARERKEREARVPEHLPVVDEVIEPEEVAAAPEAWRHIGEEATEQLDYQPARFLRRRIIRRKYVRRDEPHRAPVVATLNTLQERSIAAPGLLAQIIVAKYCDHLPLYRQEQIYAMRHDIRIPRQSMARWLGLAADWLRPVYEHIHTGVMAGGYVQVDETPVEYLSPGNGETKQGYFWACKRPGADVSFTWAASRAAQCLERIIPADFTGTVQCDGYQAYPSFAKRSEGRITLAACWAHARRKFHEAIQGAPQHAGRVILQIQHLYRVEKQLRDARAGPRQRQATRPCLKTCRVAKRMEME